MYSLSAYLTQPASTLDLPHSPSLTLTPSHPHKCTSCLTHHHAHPPSHITSLHAPLTPLHLPSHPRTSPPSFPHIHHEADDPRHFYRHSRQLRGDTNQFIASFLPSSFVFNVSIHRLLRVRCVKPPSARPADEGIVRGCFRVMRD